MKNKSEKKSAEPKKTPASRARTKKADAKLPASPAAADEGTKKTKIVKPVRSPTSTPFDKKASSPLSKEATPQPRLKRQIVKKQAPVSPPKLSSVTRAPQASAPTATSYQPPAASSPPPNLKTKPGKRPVRHATARTEVKIPSLLLEGDQPPPPSVSGPGARYALAPVPVRPAPLPSAAELPEAYGTGRVFLAARDPHWLYVSWDFTTEQQNRFNKQSRDGHLVVRIFAGNEKSPVVPDVHVHPESKSWFVHVPYAGTAYRAEIGYFDSAGTWRSTSTSQRTLTPPDAPSADVTAEFATIPVDVTFQQVVEAVQQFVTVSASEPLLEAVALASHVQHDQSASRPAASKTETPELPRSSVTRIGSAPPARTTKRTEPLPIEIQEGSEWTVEKREALARLIHIDSFRRVWMGSMEITELVRRQLQEEVASISAAEKKRVRLVFAEQAARLKMDVSSPAGGELLGERKFWFKINAELIIYGATEPNASVTIADRPIKLRPDGTFSFRFSLPDGRYQLPAIAISSDGEEAREARLEFSRSTEYRGDVPPHSQDSALRPPRREHLG